MTIVELREMLFHGNGLAGFVCHIMTLDLAKASLSDPSFQDRLAGVRPAGQVRQQQQGTAASDCIPHEHGSAYGQSKLLSRDSGVDWLPIMPGRLPTAQDFENALTLAVTPPPAGQPCTNVLVLLHGLGDRYESFKALGQQLNFPETACVSLQGPKPLPFDLGGFHWGDDIIFDQASTSIDIDAPMNGTRQMILTKVVRVLTRTCGFALRDVYFFGLGQGGMAALSAANEMVQEELGGTVSIGGRLPSDAPVHMSKSKGPVLLCKARTGSAVSESNIMRLRSCFEFVEVREWACKGDRMPSNREEMLPIMQFFARRMRSQRGVPADAIPIT